MMFQHLLPWRRDTWPGVLGRAPAKVLATTVLVASLTGCAGYIPGEKAYWDERVRELCEKDGGLRIFEKLRISSAELALLSKVNGNIGVPIKEAAHPNSPAYAEIKRTYLREANPVVSRDEVTIVRRKDQAVVARLIFYGRFGGDLPGPWHPSSYGCPDRRKTSSDLQELFLMEGQAQ